MQPVFKAMIDGETIAAAIEALESGWLGMGATVAEFEAELARFLELPDNRTVVAVNTGTSALHLALLAAGVGPGDEVLTPAFNNLADMQAILACGAEPVFVDVRLDDYGIDVTGAELMIGSATKAVLPLHYMGFPCDERVYEFAREYELRVVEDACHAIGTRRDNRLIGSEGDLQCFSFDPIKTMTCIDGGAVTCSREDADKIRRARLLGVVQPRERQYLEVGRSLADGGFGGYDVVDDGYRYHLANLHAAIGLSQLKRLPEWIVNRRQIARAYNVAFENLPIVTPEAELPQISMFGYAIRALGGERDELRAHLWEHEIDSGVHWRPAHWLTRFRSCRGAERLPVSDLLGSEIMTLPLWSEMDEEELACVVDAVWGFYG